MICPELGVAPLVDPGTDVEDERLTPAVSPLPVVDGVVPLSANVDVELCQVFQDVSALSAMPTPVRDPEGGSMMTPARYPVPPIPDSSVVMADPLEVTSPAGPAAEGPAVQMSSPGSVVQSLVSPTSPAMSTPVGSPQEKHTTPFQSRRTGRCCGGGRCRCCCPARNDRTPCSPMVSPLSEAAAMDQYLPWNGSSFGGESADCPLLPAPLTPRRMSSSP